MKLVTQEKIDEYLRNDDTNRRINEFSRLGDESLTCQQWLRESAPKRFVFEQLYGDLFSEGERKRVLDVGGGLTCFTRVLAIHHNYHLVDLLAHDSKKTVDKIEKDVGREFALPVDWYSIEGGEFDLVVANDIFPNVDQRLELFLELFLPKCKRMRVSLTWYNNSRFYMTKRVNSEEILCMLAWDKNQLQRVLEKYVSKITNPNINLLGSSEKSVYANGRYVCLVEFKGDLD